MDIAKLEQKAAAKWSRYVATNAKSSWVAYERAQQAVVDAKRAAR